MLTSLFIRFSIAAGLLLTLASVGFGTQVDDSESRQTVRGARVDMARQIERPFHEINRDRRAFFRREALAETRAEQAAAVVDLCQLYGELMLDPRRQQAEVLEGYRIKVRARLLDVQSELERRIARREKELARLRRRAAREGRSWEPEQIQQAEMTAAELSQPLTLLGGVYGGPGQFFSTASGAFGGGAFDYGDDLVRLIQRTISPDFWDVAGGAGHIHYYRPLHALVISATSDVHHQVQGLLEALHRVSH